MGSNSLAICQKEVALMLKSGVRKQHKHPDSRHLAFIRTCDNSLKPNIYL